MTSLPDVNVLLALVAAGHIHHASARDWFIAQEADSVAVCRVRQMGLLRLLTNPKVFSTPLSGVTSAACSIPRAWEVWNELLADRRVFFEYEPPDPETVWTAMMNHPGTGYSGWTDAYLAAFAKQNDYGMVTFDRDFRRWDELKLTLLSH